MRPLNTSDGRQALVPGEFLLTHEDFRQIAAVLDADSGIHLPESKATLAYSRLAKRLRTLGLKSFRDYCTLIGQKHNRDERKRMVSALTTNVTSFFREAHHFEHLKSRVLPPLLEGARRGGSVRLWSAGCSNGQEPYSIALTVFSLMPDAQRYDVKILATDIDPTMLDEGRRGVYSEADVRNVPADLKRQWLIENGAAEHLSYTVADDLRKMVAFRELNLFGAWPMKRQFHAIFCRNVVIYFEEHKQSEIWRRFMPALAPDGHLYIGHTERLTGEAANAFRLDGTTTWQLT
jgi:chemotaxis protein methyltransferase CheR